jgi:methyltransferase
MVTWRAAYLGLLALLVAERLLELRLSSRHARRLLARGGVEAGRGHYGPMVAFHVAFLVSCCAEALVRPPPPLALALAALAGALLAQALRWWAIATLGERWSTRVIVLPGAAPVTGGPYRLVRHPNYLAVALELLCVPLVAGAWHTALVFTVGNAILLAVRIGAEERALGEPWERAFRGRPRFVPQRVPRRGSGRGDSATGGRP